MKEFQGKTVMVTGAGKNIGKSIALSFAKRGANVIVCDYNRENAEQTAKEIGSLGVKTMVSVCDVRDREKILEDTKKAIEKFGAIDILINNAGGSSLLLGKLTDFVDAEAETIDFVIDTNLKGTINCIQAVLPHMIARQSGNIINMASIAALVGLNQRADYAAAKAGIIGLTTSLAIEIGRYNICINCISPGAIERDGCKMEHMTFLGENGHSGEPKEIANACLYLAGQDFVTGHNLVVDGGRILGPNGR